MKEGEDGSNTSVEDSDGGWIESPFMFFGRRGTGDVIGRSKVRPEVLMVRLANPWRPPKEAGAKGRRGTRLIGESGEDDGEGSERSEESVQDTVVVGEDSADSAVDVLSWCL